MKEVRKPTNEINPDIDQQEGLYYQGTNEKSTIAQWLKAYNEKIISRVVLVQFIILASMTEGGDIVQAAFRTIITVCSIITTIMFVLNLIFLRHLYFYSPYYGTPYVLIDILSGPVALLVDSVMLLNGSNLNALYPFDGLKMLKLFTYEKLRVITKDIFYVMPRAKRVFSSMGFVFFIFSYVGLKIFNNIHPEQFGNIFLSLLSMFQVLTFDCWNLQVNLPIIKQWGSVWSFYFIIGIFLLQFFYFNFFLSEFVTYYSKRSYRVNFVTYFLIDLYVTSYHCQKVYNPSNDVVNNKALAKQMSSTVSMKQCISELNVSKSSHGILQKLVNSYKYIYLLSVFLVEVIKIYENVSILSFAVDSFCSLFIFLEIFFVMVVNKGQQNHSSLIPILFISGIGGLAADIYQLSHGDNVLFASSCFRILVLLTTKECQFSFYKLQEVLSKLSELGIVNLMLLYITALVGYYGLYRFSTTYGFYFEDITNSYLFLLQTITFDAWGDIARAAILKNSIYAGFFGFLVLFMGFLMQNLLVGTIATIVSPAAEVEFENSRVLQKRVPTYLSYLVKESFSNAKQQEESHSESQNSTSDLKKLDQLLKDFSRSAASSGPLTVTIGGKSYSIQSRNLLSVKQ